MAIPIPSTVATVPGTLEGCTYWRDKDQLLLANQGDGKIYAVSVHSPTAPTVLGTGYSTPSDIIQSVDGMHVYIAERVGGSLLRVPLSNLNRSAAKVIATFGSGITQQIGLDEAHGYAYVLGRRATSNELLRINLLTGLISSVDGNLGLNPGGVLASSDGRYVYLSNHDTNNVVQYDLAAMTKKVVATGLDYPTYMKWLDSSEKVILIVQRGPPGMVMKLDLTTPVPSVSQVTGPTAENPCSLAVCSPDYICISTFRTVQGVSLTPYQATGPIFLGIGLVPADTIHIHNGYADTSMDPDYFFQVKDAPFGGTLPLMINHDAIRGMGAKYYKIFVGPLGHEIPVNQAYSDYCWNPALNHFELKTQVPSDGFYTVRAAGEVWLNYWLGMLLKTEHQQNGLNKISIGLYKEKTDKSQIGKITDPNRSATLMIDNSLPSAVIHQINHCVQISPTIKTEPVAVCGIVDRGLPYFTFTITARQLQKHMAGWSLVAYWGDNKSRTVADDNYNNHMSSAPLWGGIDQPISVPPPSHPPTSYWDATVPDDPTSTHCAYTFMLYAWDRVINGWSTIHGTATYHQSITIMV